MPLQDVSELTTRPKVERCWVAQDAETWDLEELRVRGSEGHPGLIQEGPGSSCSGHSPPTLWPSLSGLYSSVPSASPSARHFTLGKKPGSDFQPSLDGLTSIIPTLYCLHYLDSAHLDTHLWVRQTTIIMEKTTPTARPRSTFRVTTATHVTIHTAFGT